VDGSGESTRAADAVVEEIRASGGEAVANYDSVENGTSIVRTALDAFGRVDCVVANAGILRDVSFAKMTDAEWEAVYKVHLFGAFSVVRAAWPHFRDQKYGRVVLVSSSTGLYGNFGQANYGAAKAAILGLSASLAAEGQKRGIVVNCIAPIAASRMTESVLPPDLLKALDPAAVAPVVAFLCHDRCTQTGKVVEVGAGWVAAVRWERSRGAVLAPSGVPTIESVASAWSQVGDFSDPEHPTTTQAAFSPIMAARASLSSSAQDSPDDFGGTTSSLPLASASAEASHGWDLLPAFSGGTRGSNGSVNAQEACRAALEPIRADYTERDAALYAIAVGAGSGPRGASDPMDLALTYEHAPPAGMQQVLPSFAVLWPHAVLENLPSTPGLSFDVSMLLHGEQDLIMARDRTDGLPVALPSAARVLTRSRIAGVFDKGSGALVVADAVTSLAGAHASTVLAANRVSIFLRGVGGFNGDRAPVPADPEGVGALAKGPPSRPADAQLRWVIPDSTALLYRLCGDRNPLHVDPQFAAAGGFPRPILHGLASLGAATRHLVRAACGGNPRRVARVRARFTKHVFPGDTLVTEMWLAGPSRWAADCDVVSFRCMVERRDPADGPPVEAVSMGEAHIVREGSSIPVALDSSSADRDRASRL
jgi:(3R)-3-hydroxyacyl-CoA dehydrogenase / 3a,7a,12a-trihydroxy-5b-cholest-24-enoyl-CoA hydratase / enoyl-CoA hydratase 2